MGHIPSNENFVGTMYCLYQVGLFLVILCWTATFKGSFLEQYGNSVSIFFLKIFFLISDIIWVHYLSTFGMHLLFSLPVIHFVKSNFVEIFV